MRYNKERRSQVMESNDDRQTLENITKRRDIRKIFLQGVIAATFCVTGMSVECKATTFSELEEPKEIINLLEDVKNREEEHIQEETKMQLGREKARAKERQEAREQGLAEEKAKREAEAQKEAQASERSFKHLIGEVDLLAKIIEIEAAKSMEDRRRVGSILLNRTSTTYENFRDVHTIKEVFWQGIQYNDISKQRIKEGIEASPEAKEVAYGLIMGEIPCLEEKILFQSSEEKSWMVGRLASANLPNSEQYYAYPLNYEERCLPQ